MKHPLIRKNICVILAVACGMQLCGCSLQLPFGDDVEEVVIGNTVEDPPTLGLTPVFDYSYTSTKPSVLVDQTGYLPDSDKKAYFIGEELPDTFDVIDMESGRTVYSGAIKSRESNLQSGVYVAYGDFSELQDPGNYYLKCDGLGYSYAFTLDDEAYRPIIESIYSTLSLQVDAMLQEARQADQTYLFTEQNVVQLCEAFQIMLTTRELFAKDMADEADSIVDVNGIPAGLALMKNALDLMEASEMPSDLSEAMLATFEVKFAYSYLNMNATVAAGYGKSAATRWQQVKNRNVGTDDTNLAAELRLGAAELYRYSGNTAYQSFYQTNSVAEGSEDTLAGFLGDIVYLSTTRKVDTDLCEMMINRLLRTTEEIANDSKAQAYQVDVGGPGSPQDNLLWKMMRMSVVDYVITNHEYTTVIENHIHYLAGCNESGVAMIPLDTERESKYYAAASDTSELYSSLRQMSEALMMLHALESAKNTVILGS